MYISRITNGWRLVTLGIAAIALAMVTGITASTARADDRPFWEKADDAAKPVKASKKTYASKSASKKSSKSYAAKSTKKLGGYAEASEPAKKKHRGVKVAALGNTYVPDEPKVKKSLSGGSVEWAASSGCLDSSLKAIVYQVAANYGPLRVNSTCRSHGHNASVGGAPHSKHLSGDAVDFRVFGNTGAVYAFLKSNGGVGGLKHYGGGLFHIDNGERRSW